MGNRLAFCILLIAGTITKAYTQVKREPTGYALIVTVAKPNNSSLKARHHLPDSVFFSDLPGAVQDGKRIRYMLISEGIPEKNIIWVGQKESDAVQASQVIGSFESIRKRIDSNDLFVFYYSGHGFQIPDAPRGDERIDHKDEVFVLSDRFLVDDEINRLYQGKFSNTRNIMLADACHAGTPNRIFNMLTYHQPNSFAQFASYPACEIVPETNVDENINMIYLGASRDEAEAYDTGDGGYFTQALRKMYNKYWRSYTPDRLACHISNEMKGMKDKGKGQIQFSMLGKLSEEFKNSYLFKIK